MSDTDTLGTLVVTILMNAVGFVLVFLLTAAAVQYFWEGSISAVIGDRPLSFMEACKLVGLWWSLSGLRPGK
jgi:hypothetical protein